MNVFLWIVQGLAAVIFLGVGGMKLTRTKEQLQPRLAYMEDFSQNQIRLIGLAEVLGALGLILPALTGILPWLTPVAATGLVGLMVGAVYTHYRRKEFSHIVVPGALLVMAAIAAIGRFWISPL